MNVRACSKLINVWMHMTSSLQLLKMWKQKHQPPFHLVAPQPPCDFWTLDDIVAFHQPQSAQRTIGHIFAHVTFSGFFVLFAFYWGAADWAMSSLCTTIKVSLCPKENKIISVYFGFQTRTSSNVLTGNQLDPSSKVWAENKSYNQIYQTRSKHVVNVLHVLVILTSKETSL